MSHLPMTPLWAILHLAAKYPGIAVITAAVYYGPSIPTDWMGSDATKFTVMAMHQDLAGKPMVAITFDDGWDSVYTRALPELKSRGMVATNYLVSGFLGEDGYITANHIHDFVAAGWEIGAHSIDHSDLITLSEHDMDEQLSIPHQVLSDYALVASFSSPLGSYNDVVLDHAKGYYMTHVNAMAAHGDVTDFGMNSPDTFNPMNINRLDTDGTPAWMICENIASLRDDQLYAIIFHRIGDGQSGNYEMNFNEFRQILACIESEDVAVVTISEGAAEMEARKQSLDTKGLK